MTSLVPTQVMVKFRNLVISTRKIDINVEKLIDNYYIPEKEFLFEYKGFNEQMSGKKYTLHQIKDMLEQNRNIRFYHYLPFNYIKKNGKTIDAKGWNQKKDKYGYILKAGIKFYDDHLDNYLEVESYYSGSFNPPKGNVSQKESLWECAKREVKEELKIIVSNDYPKRKNTIIDIFVFNKKTRKHINFKAKFMGYEIFIRKRTKIRYFKIMFLTRNILNSTIIPLTKKNIANNSTEITEIRKKNS